MSTFGDGVYQFGGMPVQSAFNAPFPRGTGNAWFVDGTLGSDNNNGKTLKRPVKTIAKAIALASEGDTIYVLPKRMVITDTDPNSYAETVTIQVPNLSLIGVARGLTQGGLPQMKIGAGSTAMITIQAPGVLVANMGINGASSTGGGILFDDDGGATKSAFGAAILGCHFKNCTGSTANASSGGAVQWAAAGNAWQVLVAKNRFYKNNGGVVLKGTSGSVPQDVVIRENWFGSAVNTDVDCDVYLAGGSGVTGLVVADNVFATVDVPAGAGGGTARYLDLTGCKGIMSGNKFACIVDPALTEVEFAAAGTAAKIPTTVRMAGNTGEVQMTGNTSQTAAIGRYA